MIQTVRGKIPKEELGITMAHEHLIINLCDVRQDNESYIDDVHIICEELEPIKKLGVKSIIELTTIDMHRNVNKLRHIAEKMDMHIVCATGYYLQEYHPKWLTDATIDDICDVYKKELLVGIDDTNIKAGIIGEVASGYNGMRENEIKVLKAAARVSKVVGCAVSTHCDHGRYGVEQVSLLLGEGMNKDNLIIGHMDLILDVNYHLDILKHGVSIAFDTVSKTKYQSDEDRASHLKKLIDLGYEDHIVLSQDVSRKSYLLNEGGLGYTPVMSYFLDLLRKEGVHEHQIEKLVKYNPARIINV